MKIKLTTKNLTIENRSLCTNKEIKQSRKIVEKNLPDILSPIPDGNPWKERKEKHMEMTQKETREILTDYFKDKMIKENIKLAEFISSIHDLGRYLQAQKIAGVFKNNDYKDFENHGEASVNILKRWSALKPFSERTKEVIAYAIKYHSIKDTKSLPKKTGNQEKYKYFYLCLVRDFDKYDGFCRKFENYLFNEEAKKKQMEAQPYIEGEKEEINPKNLIKVFENKNLIDKTKVRSYEAFMLQFLAWIFDINLEVTLKETLKTEGPDLILKYFKDKIPNEQYVRIRKAYKDFKEELDY